MSGTDKPTPPEPPEGDADPSAYAETQRIVPSGEQPSREPAERPPCRSTRYRVGGVLGRGGMATIYEGYDLELNRPVAIKVLHPELTQYADVVDHFFYEAQILGQLDHPGVIPVFEAGELPGYGKFYAMKRVRGKTLREMLNTMSRRDFRRPSHTARLMGIFDKVCHTVAYAHSHGIIHRDLKPENIMIEDYGVVRVLDWGLAKKMDEPEEAQGIRTTQEGIIKGTPAYMSPEQASGRSEDIDLRTDVFALGIILYEIITGEFPFSGKTRTEVLEQIVDRPVRNPRRLNRGADRVLCAICMKSLSKDPDHRYPTAKELADDLSSHYEHLPTTACRLRLTDKISNWISRHPARAAGLGTALVFILLSTAGGYHRHVTNTLYAREQQRAKELAAELEDRKAASRLDQLLHFAKSLAGEVERLDEEIVQLEQESASLSSQDEDKAHALAIKMKELRAIRSWYIDEASFAAGSIVTLVTENEGQSLADLDPQLMDTLRGMVLAQIRSLIRVGEYYEAHCQIWNNLVQAGKRGCTEAQTSELLALKDEVEAAMRAKEGPDFEFPDWSSRDPKAFMPEGDASTQPPDSTTPSDEAAASSN